MHCTHFEVNQSPVDEVYFQPEAARFHLIMSIVLNEKYIIISSFNQTLIFAICVGEPGVNRQGIFIEP